MHTKGDWKIEHRKTKNYLEDKFEIVKPLKLISNGRVHIANVFNEADAQLIASVPDLYEELVVANGVICQLCKGISDTPPKCDYCKDYKRRTQAIAKAEGKDV